MLYLVVLCLVLLVSFVCWLLTLCWICVLLLVLLAKVVLGAISCLVMFRVCFRVVCLGLWLYCVDVVIFNVRLWWFVCLFRFC